MYTKPETPADFALLSHKTVSQCSSITEHIEKVQVKAASKISKWGAGKRTPVVMLTSFILAFVIATAHLGIFLYLDGKPLDGSNTRVPAQSYVSATSNILATLFGIAMTTSVGIVFTQYLWYLLRKSAWKLSAIESMFSMQTNPLMLQHPDIFMGAPLLGFLASFMWLINIAANFAPGALTVGPIIRYSNEIKEIPTFNSTFVGNGSGVDANLYSLDPFQVWEETFLPDSQYGTYSSTLARLTIQTMITGAPSSMSSPCGPNCSYTLTFAAPYLQCSPLDISYGLSSTYLFDIIDEGTYPIFQGQVLDPYLSSEPVENVNNSTTAIMPSQFTFKSYQAIGEALNSIEGSIIANRIETLNCAPASTIYTVSYNFTNNVLSRNISQGSVTEINDLAAPVQNNAGITFPGFVVNGSSLNEIDFDFELLGSKPLNWTNGWHSWYSNLQLMAVINSVTRPLNGTYVASPDQFGNTTNTFPSDWGLGDKKWYTDVVWVDDAGGFPTNSIANQYLQSTVAAYTKLNRNFGQFNTSQIEEEIGFGYQNYPISFTVSEEILNEFLLNTTLSMISDIAWWTTPTTITTWASINSFSFSQPLHLLLPYYISLFLTLPILALGLWTIRRNGITAMNNSFLQIATSTTGSATLEKVFAASCLGGDGNVTKELGELKVRFGELKDVVWYGDDEEKGRRVIRKAGFGIEEEVKPLVRGGLYGVE